jgi:stage II sporulation protein M
MTKIKKVRKKSFSLTKEYKQSWEYVKESKKFIYVIITAFFLFALIGFFIPAPQIIQERIMDFIKELIGQTKDMSQFDLINFIISNNVKSTFFGVIFGAFFGIFPLVGAIVNGYLLGFVSLLSVNDGGILTLWKIFPHGIFELPAVFISLGLGLKMGTFAFKKKKLYFFRNCLINSLKAFLLIIVPLLVLAGIIEGTLMFLVK